jgi:hypothetical protein
MELRKNLDTKANTMITVASGVSTLLIAIGTFLISRIMEKGVFYGVSILILGIGSASSIRSILLHTIIFATRVRIPYGS